MSKFETNNLENQINTVLDDVNAELTSQQCDDISQARIQAIKLAKVRNTFDFSVLSFMQSMLQKQHMMVATPLAFSALLIFFVSFNTSDTLPHLPTNFFSDDVPMEDLTMLEELEFANWLAEQQEMVL